MSSNLPGDRRNAAFSAFPEHEREFLLCRGYASDALFRRGSSSGIFMPVTTIARDCIIAIKIKSQGREDTRLVSTFGERGNGSRLRIFRITEESNEKERAPSLRAPLSPLSSKGIAKGTRIILSTGGTAAGWVIADDTGESEAPEVKAEAMMIIFSQELSVDLADAVDRTRPLHRNVRGGISGRVRTKCADRRRDEDSQLVLLRYLDDVVHSCHTTSLENSLSERTDKFMAKGICRRLAGRINELI
jgi:hypothetical protein